jgi:RAB6A-GEF complex partner protein 1
LCNYYFHLPYFSHALEVLLHDVLDDEVDNPPPTPDQALLPIILSFLQSYNPESMYLDIVVQCTRKTEVRSWRTLFEHLPPVSEMFEVAMREGRLKTAGGYLLVLHTFEEVRTSSEQLLRLLSAAKAEADWELCKELARFLVALDESGNTLREAMRTIELTTTSAGSDAQFDGAGDKSRTEFSGAIGLGLQPVRTTASSTSDDDALGLAPRAADASGYSSGSAAQDYFSA